VQELTDLAKAGAIVGDIKELHMQAVDLSDPANVSQFDLKFCYAIAKCKGVQVLSLTYGQMESHLAHRLATGTFSLKQDYSVSENFTNARFLVHFLFCLGDIQA
jgi:DNA-binding FadR family transcriptional regulator